VQRLLAVDVLGTVLCCREAVRRMSTRHGGSGGSIVLVSSVASRLGRPGGHLDHAASKGAVDPFCIGLAACSTSPAVAEPAAGSPTGDPAGALFGWGSPSGPTRHRPRGEPMAELTRPDVEPPTGPAPDDLVIEDLVVGDGPEAKAGDLVSAHYIGVTHDGGEQFDASWDRGDPLEFRLGVGMVIQGWDEGIAGMKVGGRRRLTIPAHKAYGDRGAGGVIKPGATLVFVVDLVGVR
jgi:peptidylprolyl isomerase